MRNLRILKGILTRTRASRILFAFAVFFFIDAAIILFAEPDISSYGDALWYCFVFVTTIGFGDIAAVTAAGRIATVILSIYAVFVIAIVTGVVVNFYTHIIELRNKETLSAFIDKLERLPELSKEEIYELSENVKKYEKELPKRNNS